jgi:hypothetical protein
MIFFLFLFFLPVPDTTVAGYQLLMKALLWVHFFILIMITIIDRDLDNCIFKYWSWIGSTNKIIIAWTMIISDQRWRSIYFIQLPENNKMNCELMLTYDTPALLQTGSRNLTGQKTLPTIWGTYMKLVTKYQISAINSCWEKCAYMFNVYKNQLCRQTGSRNLKGPKTLPTIWHTYMKLVTKYQIPVINSCLEKCDNKCAYTNVCSMCIKINKIGK